MECDPHQLIEGCLIACYAAGLSQCFLYIRGEMALAHERVAKALNDAYAAGYIGKNILGTDFGVDIVLHWGAGAYVVGEETALIESLEGERGMPRLKPPYFPAAVGLYGQPTIVNNVETLSNLPFIALNGSAAYTAIGTETSPGTRMIAVSGHVERPGVYEIVNGSTTFRDLIYGDDFAQGIRDGNELKTFVPGGGSAPWFLPDQLDIPFEGRAGRSGRLDARIGRRDGDGLHHRHPGGGADAREVLRPRVVRQVRAVPRGRHVAVPDRRADRRRRRHRRRPGRRSSRSAQTICPGDMPHASSERLGLEAVPFPYKMTTICFVGPSAYVPIHSAMTLFPEDFAALRHPARPIRARSRSWRSSSTTVEQDDADSHRPSRSPTTRPHGSATTSRPTAETEPEPEPDPNAVTIVVNGVPFTARKGEMIIAAADARRRLHPALLLPPADGPGRHVPPVHGRGRQRPRVR